MGLSPMKSLASVAAHYNLQVGISRIRQLASTDTGLRLSIHFHCQNFFLLFVFFLFPGNSYSQVLEGNVADLVTGKAIPYASVIMKKNPSKGTIANSEGNFRIDLTGIESDSIVVSHAAYQKKTCYYSPQIRKLKVKLTQRQIELKDIVVTASDPLLDTLKKAFNQITTNYPSTGTLIKGIYRETNQRIPDSTFDYFSEALIEIYKVSYDKKDWGTVKIVEGGIIDYRQDYGKEYNWI